MANNGCGCADEGNVTALQGATGNDGTSVIISTSPMSGVAAVHYMYTANRLYTASDDIYNSGNGYSWSVLGTVPSVPATNVITISMTAQINATDVHTVTATLLVGGAPVANLQAIQSCGLRESMSWNVQTSGLTAGQAIAIKLVSDGAAVTPVLKGGNVIMNIYG